MSEVRWPCENLQEGVLCTQPSTHIMRTPFVTRLVCDECARRFRAQGRLVVKMVDGVDLATQLAEKPAEPQARIVHNAEKQETKYFCHCGAPATRKVTNSPFRYCDKHARVVAAAARDVYPRVAMPISPEAQRTVDMLKRSKRPTLTQRALSWMIRKLQQWRGV